MKYRVHIYAVVRVPVEVEAESQQEAIKMAEESVDFHSLLSHGEYEYAEDVDGFLVDELDEDGDHTNSTWYDENGEINRTMHPLSL